MSIPLSALLRRYAIALLLGSMAGALWAQDEGMEAFKAVFAGNKLTGLEQLIARHQRSGEPFPIDPMSGATVLHKAIHLGAGESALQRLLDAGLDPNARTSDDAETPLHFAARFGCGPCARLLIARGAHIAALDAEGRQPIHIAGYAAVEALLDGGADPLVIDPRGNVPLHTVFHPRLLGAGVNVRNQGGLTPLHFAALHDSVRGIDWLLAHGADPQLRTTAPYRYRAPIMSRAFGPGEPLAVGARPLDLARQRAEATAWNLQSHKHSVARLEAVTKTRWLGLW